MTTEAKLLSITVSVNCHPVEIDASQLWYTYEDGKPCYVYKTNFGGFVIPLASKREALFAVIADMQKELDGRKLELQDVQ